MNRINHKKNFLIILFVVGSFIGVNAVFLIFSNFFDILNIRINDELYKLRYQIKGPEPVWSGGQEDGKPYIAIVELGDRDYDQLEELKSVYRDRLFDADIINILSNSDVSGIGYDTVFVKEGDKSLIDATFNAENVYYPVVLAPTEIPMQSPKDHEIPSNNLWNITVYGKKPKEWYIRYTTKPVLVNKAKGIGHININPDVDGIFRRVPLLISHENGYIPSLSLIMAVDYLDVELEHIEVTFGKNITLRDAEFPDGTKKHITIPIDDKGEMIINFAGKWVDVFQHISYSDVLDALEDEDLLEILRDEIGGKIVIIADVSSAGKDFQAVPIENVYPLSNVHANVLNSILTANFIYELNPMKQLIINLIIVVILCFSAIKTRALVFSAITLSIFLLYLVFVLWLFIFANTLTSIIPPIVGITLSFTFVNLYSYLNEEQEKAILYRTFESYFAPSVMNKILKEPDKLWSSERKILSILFTDISDFTSWCSSREPEEIRSTLNEYYSEMARIVFNYDGTVDKYMGDGILAFFGDPIEYDDHAFRAVKAAIEMQQRARELKEKWKAQGRLHIKMRIGVNTGEVVVGNMGSENRVDYTVIGSTVNLAQRLEDSAPLEGILISQSVYAELKKEEKYKNNVKDIKTNFYGKIRIKGLSEEIEVYEVKVPEPES